MSRGIPAASAISASGMAITSAFHVAMILSSFTEALIFQLKPVYDEAGRFFFSGGVSTFGVNII